MSRRNRRRNRTNLGNSDPSVHYAKLESSAVDSIIDDQDSKQPSTLEPPRRRLKRNDLSARHWHNRYMAWQTRQQRQQEEHEKLLREKRRIFGGESGEDDEDSLCSNMMEYFSGLDFIMEADA
ncbi:MAG: hypothetical protein Q9212_000837 [Teloschistes hypoglaucus]